MAFQAILSRLEFISCDFSVLSQGNEAQTSTSLQTTANEQELAFPMFTAQPEARQALEHAERPVQPVHPFGGGKPDCIPGVRRQRFREKCGMRRHAAV